MRVEARGLDQGCKGLLAVRLAAFFYRGGVRFARWQSQPRVTMGGERFADVEGMALMLTAPQFLTG